MPLQHSDASPFQRITLAEKLSVRGDDAAIDETVGFEDVSHLIDPALR
ncbi:hypothetical protein SAMN05444166_6192 [Singulisphaera sp. GP187]|nr:hypothetical protein SAMN05444166_6192 [Singulisphaera sp. GP187]